MLLADLMDNFPRLRLSEAHMELILYMWARTARHPSRIPSLRELRKFQKGLQARVSTQTRECRSELGNVFFANDVRTTLALDMANPQVAQHVVVYPELKPSSITNAWETSRWLELPLDQLTPMVRIGAHDFFVNELALLETGDFVIPYLWATYAGVLSALCRKCTYNETTNMITVLEKTLRVEAALFVRSFVDLENGEELPMFERAYNTDSHENFRTAMPNPLRAKANGEELFTLFLNAWVDDVSGNVSKQWNKHWNVCFENACLPGVLLFQEYFVRFVSTSQNATAPEQLASLKEQVLSTHDNPYPCFHAGKQRSCKFRIAVQSLPADNPQQSEHCSHTIGARAHLYCRRCFNTRAMPEDDDEIADWYASHFMPGRPRTLEETRESVEYQLALACNSLTTDIETEQKSTGVKDPIAAVWIERIVQKAKDLTKAAARSPDDPSLPHTPEDLARYLKDWLDAQPGDHMNPLLNWSGLDPHASTPVEILHTILLGLAKYIWHSLYSTWKPAQEALFATRLASTDLNGLSIQSFRPQYMVQYKGALIGRQFKALTQTLVFHLHDLCTPELFTLVKACGEFSAVLWEDSIKDLSQHQADLRVLIANVLDAYGDVDPLRVLDKVKLHLLTHIPDDIPRFGPAVRSITEIFESFNAVFRMCSVLSNHHAPSLDIALSIADMDRMKHVISGGYWMENGVPTQAAENVRRILEDHPIIQKHLGWAPPSANGVIAGTAKPLGLKSSPARALLPAELEVLEKNFALQTAFNALPKDHLWRDGSSVVSNTGDVCKIGSFVFFGGRDDFDTQARGVDTKIMAVYVPTNAIAISPYVVIKEYRVSSERHPHYDMPVLRFAFESHPLNRASQDIRFIVNVQHDCRSSGCTPSGTRVVRQERTASSKTVSVLEHVQNSRYIINTHAFHNAARLRRAIPRSLTVPIPLKMDR
ncbi:hypothetical protein EXIGLDRAFT_571793, partial [Exidia glandulosa HHB12029]